MAAAAELTPRPVESVSLSYTSADPAWRAAEMMHGHRGGLRDTATVAKLSSADPWSGWIRARAGRGHARVCRA